MLPEEKINSSKSQRQVRLQIRPGLTAEICEQNLFFFQEAFEIFEMKNVDQIFAVFLFLLAFSWRFSFEFLDVRNVIFSLK